MASRASAYPAVLGNPSRRTPFSHSGSFMAPLTSPRIVASSTSPPDATID